MDGGGGEPYGWDLEENVHDEEQHDDDGIAVLDVEIEVLVHTGNGRETKIGSVDERHGVHGSQDWEKSDIDLLAVMLLDLSHKSTAEWHLHDHLLLFLSPLYSTRVGSILDIERVRTRTASSLLLNHSDLCLIGILNFGCHLSKYTEN